MSEVPSEAESCGYTFGEYINKGVYGTVHVSCKDGDCDYVAKIQKFVSDRAIHAYINEIYINTILNKDHLHVSPRMFNNWIYSDNDINNGVIIFEKMDGNYEDYIKKLIDCSSGEYASCKDKLLHSLKEIKYSLDNLKAHSISHLDLKPNNILFKQDEEYDVDEEEYKVRFYISDFGLAHKWGNPQNDSLFVESRRNKKLYGKYHYPDRFVEEYDLTILLYEIQANIHIWYPSQKRKSEGSMIMRTGHDAFIIDLKNNLKHDFIEYMKNYDVYVSDEINNVRATYCR